jgi:hypothetical protein
MTDELPPPRDPGKPEWTGHSMTMRWHLTRAGAERQRDRFDKNVPRSATNGTYHVKRACPFWKVEKRWDVCDHCGGSIEHTDSCLVITNLRRQFERPL